jgi:hypothetical protein
MKKFMSIICIVFALTVSICTWSLYNLNKANDEFNQKLDKYQKMHTQEYIQAKQEPYKYIVTEINGDEIDGLAINHRTPDNGGVVLSKKGNGINPKIGDFVEVTYGKEYDEIKSVKIVD